MSKPTVWNSDPECGHDVASAYQTHYCTYIRVPRLLTLQTPQSPDELLLITANQWYELWFEVLLSDLHAVSAADRATHQPVKLLHRGIELFKLFDLHADIAETIIVRELKLKQAIRASDVYTVSRQFLEIEALARGLPRLDYMSPAAQRAVDDYGAELKTFRTRYRHFQHATLTPTDAAVPTYAEWLHLPKLLDLQQGVKSDWTERGQMSERFWKPDWISPDENTFIIVHQCFEIWFKVLLDHVDRAIPAMQRGDIEQANRLMNRVVQIQRLLAQQIEIPATMLPLDFMLFRNQTLERDGKVFERGLSPASGTESYQFREIEIASGLRDDVTFQKYLYGSDKLPIRLLTPRQAERLAQPTLSEAFRQAVSARGITRLDDLFTPSDVLNPNEDLEELANTLLDYDEFFRKWRLNHVIMVEKMIGARSGTGFLGPEYLAETAGIKIQEKNRIFEERQVRPRFFEDLWKVRSRLGTS